jgi:hypothetical protein
MAKQITRMEKNHLCFSIPLCGTISVKNKQGKVTRVSPSVAKEQNLSGIAKGKVNVIDTITGKKFQVDKNDPILNEPHIQGVASATVVVKDRNGNQTRVSLTDPRYLSGELVHNRAKMCYAQDSSGEILWIKKSDKRIKFKELIYIKDCSFNQPFKNVAKGLVSCKDFAHNTYRVRPNDPRYISGEIVHCSSHMCYATDSNGKEHWVKLNDPRLESDLSFVRLCPFNKESAAKNTIPVLINGVIVRMNKNDPRIITGEAIPCNPRKLHKIQSQIS